MDDKAEAEQKISVNKYHPRGIVAVADLVGGAPGVCPPMAQNFLDFMQFFGKFDKIVCWRPP